MSDPLDEAVLASTALARQLSASLAGKPPWEQGAALADVLSMWLAGHYLNGPEAIEDLLKFHMIMVRQLLPMQISMLKRRALHG